MRPDDPKKGTAPEPTKPDSGDGSEGPERQILGVPVSTVLLIGLYLYAGILGGVVVNDIYHLDLFHEWIPFLTPELHHWVYDLADLYRDKPMESEAHARRTAEEIHAVMKRTRYAPKPDPESLEERVRRRLEEGRITREEALAWLAEGREEADRRLLEIEEFATLPILVKYLDDPDPFLRDRVHPLLVRIAQTWYPAEFPDGGFGYEPRGTPEARAAAAGRWRAWVDSLDLL